MVLALQMVKKLNTVHTQTYTEIHIGMYIAIYIQIIFGCRIVRIVYAAA